MFTGAYILVMSTLWPVAPHSALFPICRTPACLLASSEVISKMNQSVSACEDIRDYSCGHWLNTHTIPSHESIWGIKQHMQLKHREHLRNLIMTMKQPVDVTSVEWKTKNTYDSCMSLDPIETEGKLPLVKRISQLGGWHVMKGLSVNNWDMKLTLKKLHAEYDVHPFFKIDVIPDPRVPAQSIIQISPGKLGLPDKSYYYRSSSDKIVIAYKTFLKDIATSFGASGPYANTFSEDMFGFERRLTERFPSNGHVDGFRALHRTTVGDLETHAPSINLYDIISYMFTNIKITKKTEVVVAAPDYLVNVSQIFSSTDRIILNDYMMLKLAFNYMPFLSNSFSSTLLEFHKHLYGVKETVPRWETCIKTLQKYMGRGLEAILENSNGEREKKKKVAADLFEHIRITLRNNVMNSNNLPSHIKEHFLEKLDQMSVQIGLKEEMKDPDVYNDYYDQLSSIKDAFFLNVLKSVSFQLEKRVERLSEHNEDDRWVDGISDGSLRVIYIPELNKVAIPMALLATPYFHPHYPLSILYGTLGVEIGEAVISGLIGEGLYYSGDGMQLPDDHPVYAKKYDCLIEEQASASTRHLYAVTAAYKALKNVLAELPHVHQPALEYLENEALYFIAYAQSLCTMKTPEQQDLDITTAKSKMDDINLLDIVMHRSREFSTTFNCNRKLKKDSCDGLV
ncbi:endothelin-converting enzyme 1-like isoform X2 [Rhodnius prolixus]|uniref:endothelin-converting enzyme 1-like isoform X2 n=1 Tax=Rhodnius prolixus TaxID=13249 RepID=UPI003D18F996